ncbi:MAG: radical SAM family heme chaperone HemW [Myxococcota bacterium]
MSRGTSGADLGVYLHVPFCEHVCPYCDFAVVGVGRLSPAAEDELVELLLLEWRRWRERLAGRRIASVYFGGGTPSLLRAKSLGRLLEALAADVVFEAAAEITVELNPGQLEVSRVPELRARGVTRLSVGLQSGDGEVLRRLGRAQRADEALRGLEACLAAGFASLSADLIYGAPGQTLELLARDLERLIELGVPHVSAYALTLEPGTPFARAASAGQLELPEEDTVVDMSRLVRARLASVGVARYEISSYARPGHRARHNQRYWTRSDVLGLGPSAATLLGERRLRNARALADWRAALRAGESPAVEDEEVTPAEARREALYLGLRRTQGVSRAEYLRRYGTPPEAFLSAELARLRARELIADESGFIRLSERGLLFADDVFLELVGR